MLFLVYFFIWIYASSSLAADFTNASLNRSSNNAISAQYSLAGTIIAAALAAGVGIYSAISNTKQRSQDRKLQMDLTEINNQQSERNNKFQEELAKINTKLASQKSEEDALREYRFDALKRMYNEFEPISFQFNEACDNAVRRILLLARNTKEGKIKRFSSNEGWLAPDREKHIGRYLNETTYFLLAPMVYFKILQKKLTSIDVQLDQNINFLFLAAKDLYYTLQADDDLAYSEPKLPYDPKESKMYENPAEHSIQGINLITLDKISEELLCEGDKVMPFSKFMEKFGEVWKKQSKDEDTPQIWYITTILRRFHPEDKPVYWRVLLTQLCLYRAIKKIGQLREQRIDQLINREKNTESKDVYKYIEQIYKSFEGMYTNSELDWGQKDMKNQQAVDKEPLTAVKNYLTRDIRY